MVRRNHVSQYFCFGPFCHPDTIGELLPIVLKPFGNIPRTRTHGFAQLIRASIMPLEVRRQQEQVDAQIEQMRELPGSDIAEIGGSRHAGTWCNRSAAAIREESRVFHAMCSEDGEEIETRRS